MTIPENEGNKKVDEKVKTSLVSENGTTTFTASLNEDGTSASLSHSLSSEVNQVAVNVGTDIEGVQVTTGVVENNGDSTSYSLGASYNQDVIETDATVLSAGADVALNNGKVDASVTVGLKRNYINPDNPMDVYNDERLRQQELVQTGERFNFSQKVGYSQEQESFYSESSLMYRFNDQTFFNTTYNQSERGHEVSASADLAGYRIDYRNTENKEMETTTRVNSVDFMKKGGKNQFNANFAFNDVYQPENLGGEQHYFSVGGRASFNRDQWGSFQDGFNAEFATSLSLANGDVSGYKLSADLAYNIYGETERCNDYLGRVKFDMSKQGDISSMDASVNGALRYNGCRTILEPAISFFSNEDKESKRDVLALSLGAYQQLGKDFGATTVFASVEAGKYWQTKGGIFDTDYYAQMRFGGSHQVSSKVALNGDFTYDTGRKWSGNIGVRYSF